MAFWDEVEPGWDSGSAYQEPRTSDTVAGDLATASQGVDNSGTGSGWGGFLQGALGKVLNYGLQRDAAQTNLQLQQQRAQALQTQPLVSASGGKVAINPTGLLLIGGLVMVVVLARGKA